MKTHMHLNRMVAGAGLLPLLLGGIFAAPALPAQPAVRKVDNRTLLIFDTSAEMKRRLPAVQSALSSLLTTHLSRQLHSNDSIGVWTFDQELRTGEYPLQRWKPDYTATLASNLNAFVGSRRYSKKTRFEALVPLLNQVAQNSERLTAVIFCDGTGELHGTPYDTGVNQIFQQRGDERQRARQPIVIVLRSQLGEYVDCMVSFPPQPISLPEFPPLPEPPRPAPKVVPPPAPPRPPVQPLIIIGTPATNRVPPPAPPLPDPAPVPVPVTVAPTPTPPPEAPAPDTVSVARTGAATAQFKIAPALLPPTNDISPPPDGSGRARGGIGTPGVVLLVVAGALVAFMLGRAWPAKKN
jgi:hypothetical protein